MIMVMAWSLFCKNGVFFLGTRRGTALSSQADILSLSPSSLLSALFMIIPNTLNWSEHVKAMWCVQVSCHPLSTSHSLLYFHSVFPSATLFILLLHKVIGLNIFSFFSPGNFWSHSFLPSCFLHSRTNLIYNFIGCCPRSALGFKGHWCLWLPLAPSFLPHFLHPLACGPKTCPLTSKAKCLHVLFFPCLSLSVSLLPSCSPIYI